MERAGRHRLSDRRGALGRRRLADPIEMVEQGEPNGVRQGTDALRVADGLDVGHESTLDHQELLDQDSLMIVADRESGRPTPSQRGTAACTSRGAGAPQQRRAE